MKKITIAIIVFLLVNINISTVNAVYTAPSANGPVVVAEIKDIETIFSNVVRIFGVLLGFAFFIMLVLGGVKLLMSGGDPKAVQAAKGTITWAIAGLAFFALAFTILLLIQAFTGVDVTTFKLFGY